jgi:hypothetical protein
LVPRQDIRNSIGVQNPENTNLDMTSVSHSSMTFSA